MLDDCVEKPLDPWSAQGIPDVVVGAEDSGYHLKSVGVGQCNVTNMRLKGFPALFLDKNGRDFFQRIGHHVLIGVLPCEVLGQALRLFREHLSRLGPEATRSCSQLLFGDPP